MQDELSVLNLMACALYAIVSLTALWAGREARAKNQKKWHRRVWNFVAVLFVCLIFSRMFELEQIIRTNLRDLLVAQDLVERRREIQGPLIAIGMIGAGLTAMIGLYYTAKNVTGRRNLAVATALGACAVMTFTMILRTVSLHALDRYLDGPLKLNWVGDVGSSLSVFVAGIIYIRIVNDKL